MNEPTIKGKLSLYFKTNRQLCIPKLYKYLKEAASEDIVSTFILVFHLRDCRGGKGERLLGIKAMQWLFLSYPKKFMKVIRFIPEYGRWDDLIYLWPRVLNTKNNISEANEQQKQNWREYLNRNFYVNIKSEDSLKIIQKSQFEIVQFFGNQLKEDLITMSNCGNVSLCAKWAPTEKDSLDRKYNTVNELCNAMSINKAKYRKIYTSPLRSYLKVTESLMCRKDWESIDINIVPFQAMKKLKKAFQRHIPNSRLKYLPRNKARLSLISKFISNVSEQLYNKEWKELEQHIKKSEVFSNTLAVIDTSISMTSWKIKNSFTFTPMDVAIGLGILISSCCSKSFHNLVVNFSNTPVLINLINKNMNERCQALLDSQWAGRMNFDATFDLILEKAKQEQLSPTDIPKRLFIISDIDFESASGETVNFDIIDKKFESLGYKRPDITFWNLCGSLKVLRHTSGSVLISGFHSSILDVILRGENPDLIRIMKRTLDQYNVIELEI
jgi:hypothetical protein